MNNRGEQRNMQQQNDEDNGDASYEYRPSDAYLRKEMSYKMSLLAEEFKLADANKDELITEQELLQFLDSKVFL